MSEVVIESPDHVTRFIDLPDENASAAVTEWARRVGHWAEDPRFDFQMFFKNEGAWAGASLSHAHSQVVALNESPREAKALWDDSSDWRAGRQERTVVETDHFIAFSPKAPRFAAETWIAPQETGSEFAGLAGDAIATTKLASLLQSLLGAFSSLGIEHFNLMLQQPPRSQRTVGGSDWRIEVAPRVAMLAGFELATGAYINTISPEDSAKKLRSSMARSTEGL